MAESPSCDVLSDKELTKQTPALKKPLLGTKETVSRVLYSAESIQSRCQELGAQISRDYQDTTLVCVGVLRGGYVFFADLLRCVQCPLEVAFVQCSSYKGRTESSGTVELLKDVAIGLRDRHVLIVEDIIDTGITLDWLTHTLRKRQPKSLEVCCLLSKKARRVREVAVKYVGFADCPDEWVIGYGFNYHS